MRSVSTSGRRVAITIAALAASALVLTGCSSGNSGGSDSSGTLTIGTTDKVISLDPAGSYDNGSLQVMQQVDGYLMDTPYGSADVKPGLAASASFTTPTTYTVKLRKDLKFANGHKLTSSDVKFTFDRMLKINDPNGPASLLSQLVKTDAPDPLTVNFTLKAPNDQTFPQILSSAAGPIVDEQVFSPNKITPDQTIVKANAFAGQYMITSYDFNKLIQYIVNPNYQGLLPKPKTSTINVKYYSDASNMKLDVQKGDIDVAFRSLSATDIASLRKDKNVKVVDGPGGELRYIVFNFDTMPYGAKTPEADPAKALAVRRAAADLVDRSQIASQVYKNTYTPVYSFVPQGLTGATDVLKSLYGDGNGGPDADKAKAVLEKAGVTTPVTLNLQYNGDHYGPSSGDEYALVKDQLESSGLFKVNLQQTEYVQYSKDRVKDVYPAYQLGWFPDYSDADNYLSPFFVKDNFLVNHYDSPQVQALIAKQVGTKDKAERTKVIEEIQAKVAADLPTLPLLQGAQVAVVGKNVTGAQQTLDPSFKFHYGALAKGK
jgi:peptide/nickel transport system substrate-binding protein